MIVDTSVSIESMIKFINKRLGSISEYFGVKSYEYHRFKTLIYQELGNIADPLLKENHGKITISRAKRALEAFKGQEYLSDTLQEVYSEIKGMGTVRQLANEYMNYDKFTMKELSNPDIRNVIKDMSHEKYRSMYTDDDIYQEVNRLIKEESKKYGTDEFDETYYDSLEEIHDVLTEKGRKRDLAYARAEKMLNDAKIEHEKWLVNRALEKAGEEVDLGENE